MALCCLTYIWRRQRILLNRQLPGFSIARDASTKETYLIFTSTDQIDRHRSNTQSSGTEFNHNHNHIKT